MVDRKAEPERMVIMAGKSPPWVNHLKSDAPPMSPTPIGISQSKSFSFFSLIFPRLLNYFKFSKSAKTRIAHDLNWPCLGHTISSIRVKLYQNRLEKSNFSEQKPERVRIQKSGRLLLSPQPQFGILLAFPFAS